MFIFSIYVKVETQFSITSTKSDISKHTKTDSTGSEAQDLIGKKISQDSPVLSVIDKADSLADLQQSTEKDFSFVSQTESKVKFYCFVTFPIIIFSTVTILCGQNVVLFFVHYFNMNKKDLSPYLLN